MGLQTYDWRGIKREMASRYKTIKQEKTQGKTNSWAGDSHFVFFQIPGSVLTHDKRVLRAGIIPTLLNH